MMVNIRDESTECTTMVAERKKYKSLLKSMDESAGVINGKNPSMNLPQCINP